VASRSLGTLTLDLIAKIGGFTRGMDEAERKADSTARAIARKQAQRAKEMEKLWVGVGAAIGSIVAEAGAALVILDQLIKGAAGFKDLEETTGGSAEGLASMAVAAATAEVSMDTLAANSIRLTKALNGVDGETKVVAAAIKALGLDLDEFKSLDPVAQMDALTEAFAGFADGQEKTAVATALWGKAGAEMLKVIKALQEQGGRLTILTQQQIEQADAYADAQARAKAELLLYSQAAATEAAPAMLALTEAATDLIKEMIGVDKETGKLGASTAVKDFAVGAVEALGFVIDAGDGVIRVIKGIAATAVALQQIKSLPMFGGFAEGKRIISELGAELDALAQKQLFSERLAQRLRAGTDSALRNVEDRGFVPTLPRIRFSGTGGGGAAKKAKEEIDKVAKAMDDLERDLALFGQDEIFKKAFDFEGLGAAPAKVEEFRAKLQQLKALQMQEDVQKIVEALERERDEFGKSTTEIALNDLARKGLSGTTLDYARVLLESIDAQRKQKEDLEEIKQLTEQFQTPLDRLLAKYARLNELLSKGLRPEVYARGISEAQDEFDKLMNPVIEQAKKTNDIAKDLGLTFTSAFEDAIVNGGKLSDVLRGLESDIIRIITRKLVTEPLGNFLTSQLQGIFTPSGGGIFSGLFASIGNFFGGFRADGGPVSPNQGYIVGERGREWFQPNTAGTIVPMEAMKSGKAGDTYHITVPVQGMVDRRTREQIASTVAMELGRSRSRATA
jgi:hypothetical protein